MPKEAVDAASLEVWSQYVDTPSFVEIKEHLSDDWNLKISAVNQKSDGSFFSSHFG